MTGHAASVDMAFQGFEPCRDCDEPVMNEMRFTRQGADDMRVERFMNSEPSRVIPQIRAPAPLVRTRVP